MFGVFAWGKQLHTRKNKTNEVKEEDREEASEEGGKKIRMRSSESTRDTYGLFLGSGCLSHCENRVAKGRW